MLGQLTQHSQQQQCMRLHNHAMPHMVTAHRRPTPPATHTFGHMSQRHCLSKVSVYALLLFIYNVHTIYTKIQRVKYIFAAVKLSIQNSFQTT